MKVQEDDMEVQEEAVPAASEYTVPNQGRMGLFKPLNWWQKTSCTSSF